MTTSFDLFCHAVLLKDMMFSYVHHAARSIEKSVYVPSRWQHRNIARNLYK
jgi:hypothetical protein